MRRRYNPFLLPTWVRRIREVGRQLIVPFTIFQGIRALMFPTTFDVILLLLFLVVAVAFHMELI